MKLRLDDPGGPRSPAARKKTKNSAESRRKGREKEVKREGPTPMLARKTTVRREDGENFPSWTYHGSLQGKLREAIKKRIESYSLRIMKVSSEVMHLVKEMCRDVTHMETVEIPDKFFDTTFIRHRMLGTEEARKKTSGFLNCTKNILFTALRVLDTRVTGIFTCTRR